MHEEPPFESSSIQATGTNKDTNRTCSNCGHGKVFDSGWCPGCGQKGAPISQGASKQVPNASNAASNTIHLKPVAGAIKPRVLIMLCLALIILRIVDGVIWGNIIFMQESSAGVGVWNVIMTIFTFGLVISMIIALVRFNERDIGKNLKANISISGLGIAWYMFQFLAYDVSIMLALSGLEAVILVVAIVACTQITDKSALADNEDEDEEYNGSYEDYRKL